MHRMDLCESVFRKRNFSELEILNVEKSEEEDEDIPKKRLRTKLVELFNRASVSLATPPEEYIKVYLRIKPYTQNEISNQKCFEITEDNTIVACPPETSHAYRNNKRGMGNSSHKFTFSRIFNENTCQADFFNSTMLDLTKDFISGQNSLVFTYGVTSSGKTFTIQGLPQNAGILPRCLDVIFNSINGKQFSSSTTLKPHMFTDVVRLSNAEVLLEKKIKDKVLKMSIEEDATFTTLLGDEMESALSETGSTSNCGEDLLPEVENRDREKLKVDVEDQGKFQFGIWVSFAEIYNEHVYDLLESFPHKKNAKRPVLKIGDDRNGNPYIKGLKEIHVVSADEAYRLLTIGRRNLQTACTRLNHCSSRSHCIFNIKIVRVVDKADPHIAQVNMLSLCDLAGSERYSKTQATGDRLKEAGNINASLMTLGRCIETLRHNQVNRDQQRLVPFRDSKLTRLLQNFFNGSGRAVMIVNVSQCPSMFDDTLHVFKFSAIAKQVKYIEKPPEPPKKAKEKRVAPPAQRPSIEWEIQAPKESCVLNEAQQKPLPEAADDELQVMEEDSSEQTDMSMNKMEMISYIKTLELRNERLEEMLQEEWAAASNNERRIRKEVTDAMMKQVVEIEETYSTMLKESKDDADEMLDERIRGMMAIYEEKIERIQRKVDEEDEWVSSLLYHQEKIKVEEKEAEIIELKKQVEELQQRKYKNKNTKEAADVDSLKQKLKEAQDLIIEKDEKIQEYDSLITEAGEVYTKNMEDISSLTQEKEALLKQLSSLQKLEHELEDLRSSYTQLQLSSDKKESEWKDLEEKLCAKIEDQKCTITSLQEECQELQDEIERLQDEMSRMDEESKCHNKTGSDSGSQSEEPESTKDGATDSGCSVKSEVGTTAAGDLTDMDGRLLDQITGLKEDVESKQQEIENLKLVKESLEKEMTCLNNKVETLVKEIAAVQEKHDQKEQDTIRKLKQEFDVAVEFKNKTEADLVLSVQKTKLLAGQNELLKKNQKELTEKIIDLKQELGKVNSDQNVSDADSSLPGDNVTVEDQEHFRHLQVLERIRVSIQMLMRENSNLREACNLKDDNLLLGQMITENICVSANNNINIGEMVKKIEQKSVDFCAKSTPQNSKNETATTDSDDSEIIISHKKVLKQEVMTPCLRASDHLTTKVKDLELANTALRSKLKQEEEDYFKREQALIHGYTAEIEQLKYDLARLKTKCDIPGRSLPPRGKRKVGALDTSTVSSTSVESASLVHSLMGAHSEDKEVDSFPVALLSEELMSVQQQLLSLDAAFRRLQALQKRNTNIFVKDVVLGTGNRGSAEGAFLSEEYATESILQFELDEYSVKFDELKKTILEQENEIRTCKTAYNKVLMEKSEIEKNLKEVLLKQEKEQESELASVKEQLLKVQDIKQCVELELQELARSNLQLQAEIQEKQLLVDELNKKLGSTACDTEREKTNIAHLTDQLSVQQEEIKRSELELSRVQKELEDMRLERDSLTVTIKNLQERELQNQQATKLEELKTDLEEVRRERDSLTRTVSCLKENEELKWQQITKLEELQSKFQQAEVTLKNTEEDLSIERKNIQEIKTKLEDSLSEKAALEESLKSKCEQLKLLEDQMSALNDKCDDLRESLKNTTAAKQDVEQHLSKAREQLTTAEASANRERELYESRISTLTLQVSEKGEAHQETISQLKQRVEDLKTHLQGKSAELEKVECLRQEEQAEVSQKLILLEKEKKQAEKRANEMKDKMEDFTLKFQELDKMKELQQQFHQQLRTAAENVRSHSLKTSELKQELDCKNQELNHLNEELALVRRSSALLNKTIKDLESKVQELEQAVSSEREVRLRAEESIQEYSELIATLKKSLQDSVETVEQQVGIIDQQDEELSSLRLKYDTLLLDKDKVDKQFSQKEKEAACLNSQLSKLETERQHENKLLNVENMCQNELEKIQAVKNELESKLKTNEKDKLLLEAKLETIEKDKCLLEAKLETIEKDKFLLEAKLETIEKDKFLLEAKLETYERDKVQLEAKLEISEREKFQLEAKFENCNRDKAQLEAKLEACDKDKFQVEEKLSSLEKLLRKEKSTHEDIEEKLEKSEKKRLEAELQVEHMNEKQKMWEEDMSRLMQQRMQEMEQTHRLETELRQLKKEVDEGCFGKTSDELKKDNDIFQTRIKELEDDLHKKTQVVGKLEVYLQELTEAQKNQEKELQKQEKINKRNREEMENWKQERDACVSQLELHIKRRQQENEQLHQENEQLKRDNSDLAKNANNITNMKDTIIAELRKTNNTLSIQLARVQGMSPPPKMATPDSSYLTRLEFNDDLDTTGHLEIDATPPIAAKKCRKRNGSYRGHNSSPTKQQSLDPESTPTPNYKPLKPIEEQNESSPGCSATPGRTTSPTKIRFPSRVADIASEVMASISPLTRSGRKQDSRKKKSSTLAPLELASQFAADDVQNENANPYSTRRSSRLRTRTKNSLV